MIDKWCKCKIVEPMIRQAGDDLVCTNCYCRKEMPPQVDFEWEKLKKSVVETLCRPHYESFCKEGLVNLLIKRDKTDLEIYNIIYESCKNYGPTRKEAYQIIKLIEGQLTELELLKPDDPHSLSG